MDAPRHDRPAPPPQAAFLADARQATASPTTREPGDPLAATAATAVPAASAPLSSTLDMPELPPDAFAILSSLPDGP
jgi:hypothetical protein